MNRSGRIDQAQEPIFWPWFVGGLLTPPVSSVLSRWAADYIAGALAFFVLFSAAAVIVTRRQSPRPRSARLLAGSAAGAAIAGTLHYMFP